jgi:molecular chaperone HtpG
MTTEETYTFKTEVKQVLHILVHSLYKDRDIFLRELVSNASDALTRFHFESLTNRDVLEPDAELAIHIEAPETAEGEPKKIIIKDSGLGMTRDELIRNLGTIAQSGAREFLAKISTADVDPGDVIGQFGVGFYSVFMVADEVRVVSRSYQPEAEAAAWISDGSDSFRLEPAEKATGAQKSTSPSKKTPKSLPTTGNCARSSKSTPISSATRFTWAKSRPISSNLSGAKPRPM